MKVYEFLINIMEKERGSFNCDDTFDLSIYASGYLYSLGLRLVNTLTHQIKRAGAITREGRTLPPWKS